MTRTVWLITARGGSKGVPGKNLRKIGGISLVEWKVLAARAADPAAEIVCSSDSLDILSHAAFLGAKCIQRPDALATDTARSVDVIRHALDVLTERFDQVVLLEPSAPFTTAEQYKRALQMMEFNDADLVVGMKETAPHTAFIGDMRTDDSVTPIIVQFQRETFRRRQDYPRQWTMSGGLYVFRTDMFRKACDIYGGVRNYGLLQDKWTGLEIDTPEDLEMAEYAFGKGYVKPAGSDDQKAGSGGATLSLHHEGTSGKIGAGGDLGLQSSPVVGFSKQT